MLKLEEDRPPRKHRHDDAQQETRGGHRARQVLARVGAVERVDRPGRGPIAFGQLVAEHEPAEETPKTGRAIARTRPVADWTSVVLSEEEPPGPLPVRFELWRRLAPCRELLDPRGGHGHQGSQGISDRSSGARYSAARTSPTARSASVIAWAAKPALTPPLASYCAVLRAERIWSMRPRADT